MGHDGTEKGSAIQQQNHRKGVLCLSIFSTSMESCGDVIHECHVKTQAINSSMVDPEAYGWWGVQLMKMKLVDYPGQLISWWSQVTFEEAWRKKWPMSPEKYYSGWCFGTFFMEHFLIFLYIENNHPNWRTHIFQRYWNHQPILSGSYCTHWCFLYRGKFDSSIQALDGASFPDLGRSWPQEMKIMNWSVLSGND